jgi:hypothetical protein
MALSVSMGKYLVLWRFVTTAVVDFKDEAEIKRVMYVKTVKDATRGQ